MDVPTNGYRYDAFISYRHVEPDRKMAKWLHSVLETYRVPAKLVREKSLPRRLNRVFRDEEELAASSDLSREIDEALTQSRYLIVVCSPSTPASEWVDAEVVRFRQLNRDNRIIALLVEGEPRDSFPRSLCEIRRAVVDSSGITTEAIDEIEPLAADIRPQPTESRGHVFRMAQLRILACLLGCRFDELRRREQERQTRRLMAAGGFLAILLLVMMGLTVFAFSAKREADYQRGLADKATIKAQQNAAIARKQSQLALESLESVIFEIQTGLREVPGAANLRKKILQTAVARLQAVSDQFVSNAAIDRNTMAALTELGDALMHVDSAELDPSYKGSHDAARKVYEKAFEIALKLIAVDQPDREVWHGLSVLYLRLGDMRFKGGQVDEALEYYEKAFELHQILGGDAADAPEQRGLSISYNRLGDMSLRAGRLDEALDHYNKGLEICEKLAALEPTDVQLQSDLSHSYNHIGDVKLKKGEVQDAIRHYEKGLEIRQKLADADPTNAVIQRDLSLSYKWLGGVCLEKFGQVQKAMEFSRKAVEISEKLAEFAPQDPESQHGLSLSHRLLGRVHLQAARAQEATVHFEKAVEISQKLTARNPTDAERQLNLSDSYGDLGAALFAAGKLTEAQVCYQKKQDICQKLFAANPNNAEARRALLISYEMLGNLFLQSGKVNEAIEQCQKEVEVTQKLATANFSDTQAAAQAQYDFFVSLHRLATIQRQAKAFSEAIASYEKELEALERLAALPQQKEWVANAKQAIEQCKLAALATGDWSVIEALPQAQQQLALYFRVAEFAGQGKLSQAADALERWIALKPTKANDLYAVACGQGLIVSALRIAHPEPNEEQKRREEKYLAASLATLRQAINAGYSDFESMGTDADLAPLHNVPEFQKLVRMQHK